MTRKSFNVGDKVQFVFMKTPATQEGKSLFSKRASNMAELSQLEARKKQYTGGWVNQWVVGTVEDLTCHSYKVEGYWIPNEEVRSI